MRPDDTRGPSERRLRWMLGTIGAGAFATLLALEVVTEGGPLDPLKLLLEALELALLVAAATAVTLLVGRLRAQQEENAGLARDLECARIDGEAWRTRAQAHLVGLGAAIAQQFEAWRLSGAESEVALLLIKGFSHKEIGALRSTSDATVRQQARAIYDKAGLKGRAGLSAYFLEDLLTGAAPSSPHVVTSPAFESSTAV